MLLREEKGAAIFVVLIALMVLTVLGSVIAFAANTEGKQSVRSSDKKQAYYLARSGAEIGSDYVIKKFQEAPGNINTINDILTNEAVLAAGEIKEVKFEDSQITSIGSYNGVEQTVIVQFYHGTMFDFAVFVLADEPFQGNQEPFWIDNNVEINGPIGGNYDIRVQGERDIDDFDYNDVEIDDSHLHDEFDIEGEFPNDCDCEDCDPDDEINLPSNKRFICEEIDEDKEFETNGNDMFVKASQGIKGGVFSVKGGGVLHLLVEGGIDLSGGNDGFETDDDSTLIIYALDGKDLKIKGSAAMPLNLYIYAPDSEFVGSGGGSGHKINGGFLVKGFDGFESETVINHDEEIIEKVLFYDYIFEEDKFISFARGLWLD